MADREHQLQAAGVVIGGDHALVSVNVGFAPVSMFDRADTSLLSGYSDYTPVRVRSHTKRKSNADVERDKNRN